MVVWVRPRYAARTSYFIRLVQMPETIILVGDALSRLKDLDDNTFNVVVTSPPYYGLRNYETGGEWMGGNNPNCTHVRHQHAKVPQGLQGRSAREIGQAEALLLGATIPDDVHNRYPASGRPIGNGRFKCDLCGAIKIDLQIGLESSPEEFIEAMVEVCRGIKRVLRPDGTFWLNIGDSYANKSLLQIPVRVALALQQDGWYLRSEIIWAKTSAMPESIKDRPTAAHEKIFLLTKQSEYFFDGYAVEDLSVSVPTVNEPIGNGYDRPSEVVSVRNIRNFWLLGPEPAPEFHYATFVTEIPRRAILSGLGRAGVCAKCGIPWKSNGKSNRGRNWTPTCLCGSNEPVGGMVLDPFLGSGTTALVANSLGHDCVGIELNSDNAVQARHRIMDNGRFTNKVVVDEEVRSPVQSDLTRSPI